MGSNLGLNFKNFPCLRSRMIMLAYCWAVFGLAVMYLVTGRVVCHVMRCCSNLLRRISASDLLYLEKIFSQDDEINFQMKKYQWLNEMIHFPLKFSLHRKKKCELCDLITFNALNISSYITTFKNVFITFQKQKGQNYKLL